MTVIGLLVVVEEAFINISSYTYHGWWGDAEISSEGDGDVFVLELADKWR